MQSYPPSPMLSDKRSKNMTSNQRTAKRAEQRRKAAQRKIEQEEVEIAEERVTSETARDAIFYQLCGPRMSVDELMNAYVCADVTCFVLGDDA